MFYKPDLTKTIKKKFLEQNFKGIQKFQVEIMIMKLK